MVVIRTRFRFNLILSCAVTACVSLVMITCLSVSVCAAGKTYSTGYYYYEIEDESAVVTGYFGNDKAIEIPSSMAGYPVSAIGSGAFVKCTKLKKITLPDTIMTIGQNAFRSDQEVIYPERLAKERDKAIEDEEQNTAGQSSGSGSGSSNSGGSSQSSSGSGSGAEADLSSEDAGLDGTGSGSKENKSGSSGSTGGSDPAAAEESGKSGAGIEADITDSISENKSEGTSFSSSGSAGTIVLVIAVIAAIIAASVTAAVVFSGRKKK